MEELELPWLTNFIDRPQQTARVKKFDESKFDRTAS
jgi:hypothetical protein